MFGPTVRCQCLFGIIVSLMLIPTMLIEVGCGGGSSQSPSTPLAPQPGSASFQINIGDYPSDRLLAFAMTINSMSLTNSTGSTVNLVSNPVPLEMMQLMGTMQPLAIMTIPQGTYTKATMTIGSATVTYMDPVTMQAVQKTVPGMTATIQFDPNVTMNGTPSVMNFDMDMAASVFIDGAGNVTMNPTLHMTTGAYAVGSHDPVHGGMEHMFGAVANISGGSFTMAMMQGLQNPTFMTNSNTQFVNMGGMGMMSSGNLIMVDAEMRPDGSMLADRVESIMSGGLMAGGMMTNVTDNPATQLTLIAQNGAGTGMMASYLANGVTVSVSGSTTFSADTDEMDMSNLPFTPQFDGTSIFKGQRVYAVSAQTAMGGGMGGMMTGTVNASDIRLEPQGLNGIVSNYAQNGSQATFTLTMPPDSAFAVFTGSNTVAVFQQSGTVIAGLSSVPNGAAVHVRGLLFMDGGTYKMVAARITTP